MTIIEKIKLLLKLNAAYKQIKEASMKSKWFEREFILTVLTVLGSLAAAIAGYIPVDLLIKVSGSVVAVFTIARAIVKATATQKDDEILEKIATILKNLGIKIPEQPK